MYEELEDLYSEFRKGLKLSPKNLHQYVVAFESFDGPSNFFERCSKFLEIEKILVHTSNTFTEKESELKKVEKLYKSDECLNTTSFDYYVLILPFEFKRLFHNFQKKIQDKKEYEIYEKLRSQYHEYDFELPFSNLKMPIFPVEFQ